MKNNVIIYVYLTMKGNDNMRIILASHSPRRKELMDLMGLNYEVMVSHVDETLKPGLTIEEQGKRLGYIKAKAVFDKTEGDRIVIGSDTMVFKDNEVFGKPKNKEEAIRMLNTLKNTDRQKYGRFKTCL